MYVVQIKNIPVLSKFKNLNWKLKPKKNYNNKLNRF